MEGTGSCGVGLAAGGWVFRTKIAVGLPPERTESAAALRGDRRDRDAGRLAAAASPYESALLSRRQAGGCVELALIMRTYGTLPTHQTNHAATAMIQTGFTFRAGEYRCPGDDEHSVNGKVPVSPVADWQSSGRLATQSQDQTQRRFPSGESRVQAGT